MKLIFTLLGVLLGISMCNYRNGWSMFLLLLIALLGLACALTEYNQKGNTEDGTK